MTNPFSDEVMYAITSDKWSEMSIEQLQRQFDHLNTRIASMDGLAFNGVSNAIAMMYQARQQILSIIEMKQQGAQQR